MACNRGPPSEINQLVNYFDKKSRGWPLVSGLIEVTKNPRGVCKCTNSFGQTYLSYSQLCWSRLRYTIVCNASFDFQVFFIFQNLNLFNESSCWFAKILCLSTTSLGVHGVAVVCLAAGIGWGQHQTQMNISIVMKILLSEG